jgi:sulfonate transport system ATP-binding protein
MPDEMLAVQGLTRRFGDRAIIDHLSFAIPRSGRMAIFAPSGAGKTTLINILTRLDRRYEGEFKLSALRTATIFQEPRLLPHMTVEENIFLALTLQKAPVTAALLLDYRRWLDVCGLAAYTRHYPYQLSRGMKQKVALVRGFLPGPDFVMLDEPFASIDVRAKQAIVRHILEVYPHITVLLATHALDEIPLLAQSLLCFKTDHLADPVAADATKVLEVIYD